MHTPFHLDLKVNRRKAGLSQRDVAHLMGVHPTKVSLLEAGKCKPTVQDLAALAIVFGRTFEEVSHAFMRDARHHLTTRIKSMPQAPTRWLPQFNRQFTLDDLAARLAASQDNHEAA